MFPRSALEEAEETTIMIEFFQAIHQFLFSVLSRPARLPPLTDLHDSGDLGGAPWLAPGWISQPRGSHE